MDSNTAQNENELLLAQISELKQKLARSKGFMDFVESDTDPTHTLRSALVNMQSFISVMELLEYRVNQEDLKEMSRDLKQSTTKLLSIMDEICKTL